ncbi:COG3650 family protein [Aurantiacibacter aquimixticola]|uniref:Uncharacterized protein n=1 Tax=Aurantiacibacter aquimixticola TaxID=1958945 RepID=A0A419RX86_9SPHN|nr:hypothetical protein [Aurantiacibacter aquimixticola]RJY10387.1 hypothetical protein D6201_11880 [Aurantiacibacter aquimixticola]
MRSSPTLVMLAFLTLSACSGGADTVPGDTDDMSPYGGIAEDATIRIAGNEPFWGGTIADGTLTWTTPEDMDGAAVPVDRFAGRGGVSFSGMIEGRSIDIAITPGECSDTMSDRRYPFHASVALGRETLSGCAWREGIDELGEP